MNYSADQGAHYCKVLTIQKSITGQPGEGAKLVNLTPSSYIINYNADGGGANPSGSLTLTAASQGFNNPEYRFTLDGNAGGCGINNNPDDCEDDNLTFKI